MMGAVYGASLLDKLGRRKMLLGGLAGGLIAYILLTAFTAASETHKNYSYGVIVSIYIFGICFAWGQYWRCLFVIAVRWLTHCLQVGHLSKPYTPWNVSKTVLAQKAPVSTSFS